MSTNTLTRLLSAKEVGDIICRHEKTVLALAAERKIGCVRQGPRQVQFTEQHVADYLASCEVPAVDANASKSKRNPRYSK